MSHSQVNTDSRPDPPDSIRISDFVFSPNYGRYPLEKSRNPFTCGLTGKTYNYSQAIQRQECLARAISKRLGWLPNEETEWDKVACIFSFNSVRAPHTLVLVAVPYDDRSMSS